MSDNQNIESSSVKAKRAAKNTAIMYIRMLFMMIIGLYTSRVILESLGINDYGLYNVIGGVVGFLGFINSSLAVATIRYITYEQGQHANVDRLHSVFCTARTIHLFLSAVIFILAETIGLWYVLNVLKVPDGRMTATLVVYQFTILQSIISIISVPYNALINAYEKMSAFAYISIYESIINLSIAFIIKYIPYDRLMIYGFLLMLMQISVQIIYSKYCRRNFLEVNGKWVFDISQFKEMLKFALWISNGTLAVVAYTQGLNLLLNAFYGPVVNAARGIAVQVQQKIFMFCSNFQTSIKPQIIKSYSEGDFNYLHKLILNSSNISFYLIFLISLPVFIQAPFILNKWLTEVPEYSVSFLRLTLIVGLLESLKMPMNTSIHATGNIKLFQTFEATSLLLIIPISYVCLKLGYSPTSVFIVQAVLFFVAQIIRGFIVCPAIHMALTTYFKDCLMKIMIVISVPSILMTITEYCLPIINEWLHFFISCSLSFILSCISILYIGLDRNMRFKVRSFIKNKIYKL